MRKLLFIILVSALALNLRLGSDEIISNGRVTTKAYQGDLVLNGNNVTTIEGYFEINGSIYVEENATLILKNAIVNFTKSGSGIRMQYPANGNPRLQAENTGLAGLTDNRFSGNSSATFSNLTGSAYFYFSDETTGDFVDCTSGGFQARESSAVTVSNSTLQSLNVVLLHGNATVANLSPGFFNHWDFQSNCSVTITPQTEAPEVVISQTTINAWGFSFQGNSATAIAECELIHLHVNMNTTTYPSAKVDAYDSIIDTVELYTSATVKLTNITCTDTWLYGSSVINIYWYLDIQVLDSSPPPGRNVESANVTATFLNGTLAGQALTGVDGGTRITLMEKITNATGSYPVGAYTVDATYSSYSNGTSVNMTGNQMIALTLEGLIIPEFQSLVMLPLFVTATLLAVMACKRKRYCESE